jgi:hypothetical protein
MLDVDYLRRRPTFSGNMVYRYRSGMLRRLVRAALSDMVRSEGGELLPCRPRELRGFMINNLFYENPLVVCDWIGRSTELRANEMDDVFARIASGEGERVALFLPDHSSLPQHGAWAKIEAGCFVIEEPAVTADTLLPVLRYVETGLELKGEQPLSEQPAFIASFKELIAGKGADLVTVMRDFDVRLLTWTDPATNRFNAERYEADQAWETGRQSPQRRLRALVSHRQASDLAGLIAAFGDWYQRGQGSNALLVELYRITEVLLRSREDQPVEAGVGGRARQRRLDEPDDPLSAALWAGVVLGWESRLSWNMPKENQSVRRRPDLLLVALDHLLRDFLDRADQDVKVDRLAGLWSGIRQSLTKISHGELGLTGAREAVTRGRDRLVGPREKMVRSLATYLMPLPHDPRPAWLTRLHETVTSAVKAADCLTIATANAEEFE